MTEVFVAMKRSGLIAPSFIIGVYTSEVSAEKAIIHYKRFKTVAWYLTDRVGYLGDCVVKRMKLNEMQNS